ncbi:hypothetical protein SAMN04487821_106148 [Enterococcus malodoratus]|nr:hypothetical protein SAMN04487821_106148 [Enterococcus malodoratus]
MKTYQEDSVVQKNRWWILVSVAMFTFMSTLDSSIVNIALPTISRDLAVPMNKAEWVVSIYLMVVCACLLLFGKVGDSLGRSRSIESVRSYSRWVLYCAALIIRWRCCSLAELSKESVPA